LASTVTDTPLVYWNELLFWDAALLSAFGRALAPEPPQDAQWLQLKELVNLRDALVAEITRWKNLREH
jgi:hypothetical protein